MKKILLVFCFLIGFQMQADAVIVDPYLAPVPNYYSGSAIDFAINVGTPYPPYCDPYYPYYCRRPYYSTGVYVSPYWNVGIGWGWGGYRPHYYRHVPSYRPHHSHPAPPPAPRHYSGGHHPTPHSGGIHHGGSHPAPHGGGYQGGHSGGSHGGHHPSGGHGKHK